MQLHEGLNTLEPLDRSSPMWRRHDPEDAPTATPQAERGWKLSLLAISILIAATAAAHGWALWDGIFLDDHLHRLSLEDNNWSWDALLEAATVRMNEFIDTWWQTKPVEWHYARPFSILLDKAVYHLSGGSVKAWHAIGIVLHLANAIMVYALCMMLTRRQFWSVVGGLLFIVYSHSVYAVGWLAAQNSVLQTALTLGALLAYIRASGLNLYAAGTVRENRNAIAPRWLFLSFGLWALALFSRENAIVFPVFAAAVELAFGGFRQFRRRLPIHLLFGAVAVAFLLWRLLAFPYPMPDFYVRQPDGPAYVLWWLAKLMHFLTAAVWLSPMTVGPTGRFNPFREVPGDCVLMLAILGVMGTGYVLACRRARGYWVWPMWLLMSFLPVVPVMAAPHSGYMAGVGFAIAMIVGPALRQHLQPAGIGRWSKTVALWFLIATCAYVPIYRAMWYSMNAAERYTMAAVAISPPPSEATDVFFINLPFVNVYAQLHMAEPGRESMEASPGLKAGPDAHPRAHVLTYSPNLLRMEQSCRLEQIDDDRLRLSIEGRPYFSGALGRFLVEGMRGGERLRPGDTIRGSLFDVHILRADGEGVREMEFAFHQPLASSRYCFYITTQECGAARLRFPVGGVVNRPQLPAAGPLQRADIERAGRELAAGRAEAAGALFTAAQSDDTTLRSAAEDALRRVGRTVALALASPVQDELASGGSAPADWARVRLWWERYVDDQTLASLWVHRDDLTPLRGTRDMLFRIREIASHVIRTDLYLTGPPFPGPQ